MAGAVCMSLEAPDAATTINHMVGALGNTIVVQLGVVSSGVLDCPSVQTYRVGVDAHSVCVRITFCHRILEDHRDSS